MKINFLVDDGNSKEDAYVIGKNIFGVFDGANSASKFYKDDLSGGLIASEIVRDEFSKNKGTLTEMAVSANNKIMKAMKEEGIDTSDKLNLWCSTAAVVRIKEKTFEWLQVADSLILVINKDNTFNLLVSDYDHDAGILYLWEKYAKEKKKDIKKLVRSELDAERMNINEKWGAFDGEEKFVKFLKLGEESLKNVKHIILFTDGMFLPKRNALEEDDFDTLVQLFLDGGLARIRDHIRKLQDTDPDCWKYPRFKQYDDITAIAISF